MPVRRPLSFIFFDLDGTLIDSRQDIVNAVLHGLAAVGLPPLPRPVIAARVGRGLEMLIRRNLGKQNQHRFAEMERAFRRHYDHHLFDHTRPYPDAHPVLKELSGLPLAIISNKSRPFVTRSLSHFGLKKYFRHVYSGDDTGWHKPQVSGLRRLLAKYGVPGRRALLAGDMVVDLETARRAGIGCYLVGRGFSSPAELRAAGGGVIHRDLFGITRRYYPDPPPGPAAG